MGLFSKILGDPNKKVLNKLNGTVSEVNKLEDFFASKTNSELKEFSQNLRNKVKEESDSEDIIINSFALVREASKRLIGLRHFDVQILGGLVLHQGKISEMKTGEGKTLVATLPTYLNAIGEDSVHVITVNDYLAKRDAEWMGPIYKFLGLTIGCLQSGASFIYEFDEESNKGSMTETTRESAYKCDILYGTNNEFGFDYLRDNMAIDHNRQVQSKLVYAIVDEVDNILIDEARTPLIISGPAKDRSNEYRQYSSIARSLNIEDDFVIDEKTKNVTLTEVGIQKIENNLNIENLYDIENSELTHFIENALKAQFIFKKDQEYVVKNQQVILVDEFTGRLMQGRRLSDGLHQAIEAKENVKILAESITYATITLQNFFRMYEKLSGMTGTALTEAEEFYKIYNLEVVEVPTNSELKRNDSSDLIFKDEKAKFSHIVNEASKLQKQKSPVLIGTTSIEKSEIISSMLRKNSVPHNVLNAKFHEKEATIIAEAGKPSSVTVATNMAGRGTDIVLGGSTKNSDEWKDDSKKVISNGGLHVIGTERHESRRIDNQLRGRSGRQGDQGESIFYISLEDDLMRIFGSKTLENVLSKLGLKEGEAITHSLITKSLERAQQKVESHNYDIRKQILRFDDILNDQRKIIYQNRKEILNTKDQSKIIEDMIDDYINEIIIEAIPQKKYSHEWNPNILNERIESTFKISLPIEKWFEEEGLDDEEINKRVKNEVNQKLKDKRNKYSIDLFEFAEKRVMLFQIDKDWREHLAAMDMLRGSVNLRALGGRDPFYEYKKESFDYFDEMLSNQNERVLNTLFGIELINENKKENISQQPTKRIITKKIGRNDSCPCGSGKKYKICHGA